MVIADPLKALMKWLGVLIALGTIGAGILGGLGTYVYATKGELSALEKAQTLAHGSSALRDYRIRSLEVQIQNVEGVARRTDANVEKLLLIQSIIPAPEALPRPLPKAPFPDTLTPSTPGG